MSLAERHAPLLTVEEYLATEASSPCKREYLNGVVYAMAGGTARHSTLGVTITAMLYARLRGKRCRPFNSDMLVRIRHGADHRFYYPDAMVVCKPNPLDDRFQDRPVVIFEVLSDSTSRTDLGVKRDAYLRISSLKAYVIVDSQQIVATVYRPSRDGIEIARFTSLDESLSLPEIECELPLAEIYEGAL